MDTQDAPDLNKASGWVWYGLLAGVLAVLVLVVFAALLRRHSPENHGPPNEAAPGQHPSRDIDRSRSP
jgi:hypothetical protein